jgi:hypothetical protein
MNSIALTRVDNDVNGNPRYVAHFLDLLSEKEKESDDIMKTRNFIFTESKRVFSKTYGGSTYTMNVYEIINNRPEKIGEVTACTRAHMGEESEVWRFVKDKNPSMIKQMLTKAKKQKGLSDLEYHLNRNYWIYAYNNLGVTLEKV